MEDDRKPAAGVREGDVLAGKYRIDKVLGTGGMGVVVAAHHIQLDEKVAIKFLLPQAVANKDTVARFAREARAAVKIKSEHVARVSDVGTLEGGAPYMVMEYLDGGDLSTWLKQRGALPVDQAVEFVLQACEAIAEAHALGIVHRDLKPSNLFVTRRADGSATVKVLDFGISKTSGIDAAGMDMTSTTAVMGSPLYMSPEQMQSSKDVDARSDIWALGIILYELTTGDSPFQADTMPKLVLGIMSAAPPPLRNKRPDAPPGLEQVILKCLDKDRGKRFQTIGELAVALLDFAPKRAKISVERITGVMRQAGLSGTFAIPPSSDAEVAPASTGTKASWGKTSPAAPSRPMRAPLLIVLGCAAVSAIVLGVAFELRKGGPSPADSVNSAAPGSATSSPELAPPASATTATVVDTPPSSSTASLEGASPAEKNRDQPKPASTPGSPKSGAKQVRTGKPPASSQPAQRPPHPGSQPPSGGNDWGGRL